MSVSKQAMIGAIAKHLKGVIKAPEWANMVKTGMHKEKPPVDQDWFFTRTASVFLKVQKLGPIGVAKLRTHYGGRKNMGVAPEHTFKGSGNILRKALQQLESQGLIQKETGKRKGRVVSPKGMSLVVKTERELAKVE